mmetsp:Transcript_3659/g.8010  ORF Transcript_3659/g.8010 Transcript_3659/m.8010 type:complete len:264 (+) Transcript_3659:93-884(+)
MSGQIAGEISSRQKALYLARLAEEAERYDEMTEHMTAVAKASDDDHEELTPEERNMLAVAFKNAVGLRRAAVRTLGDVEAKARSAGREREAQATRAYSQSVQHELRRFSGDFIRLLSDSLLPRTKDMENRAFYLKTKGDHLRYMCQFGAGDNVNGLAREAVAAYQDATTCAEQGLAVTHPIRLAVALNFSHFQYEVLEDKDAAYRIAGTAFDAALEELENIPEEFYKDSTLILSLLRDVRPGLWWAPAGESDEKPEDVAADEN